MSDKLTKEEDRKRIAKSAAAGAGIVGSLKVGEYGARKVAEAKRAEVEYHAGQLKKGGSKIIDDHPELLRHYEAAQKASNRQTDARLLEHRLNKGAKWGAIGLGAGLAAEGGLYYLRHRNGKTEKVRRPNSTSGTRNFTRLPKTHDA